VYTLSDQDLARYLANIELALGHTLSNPKLSWLVLTASSRKLTRTIKLVAAIQSLLPDCSSSPGSFAILRQHQLQRIPDSQLKFPHQRRPEFSGLVLEQEVRLPEDLEGNGCGNSCLTEKGEG